jgi:Fe-S cluster assembly iron-binding protein IscA
MDIMNIIITDSLYDIEGLFFIISKEDEKYVKYIEIDYIDDWSGSDFVITAGF